MKIDADKMFEFFALLHKKLVEFKTAASNGHRETQIQLEAIDEHIKRLRIATNMFIDRLKLEMQEFEDFKQKTDQNALLYRKSGSSQLLNPVEVQKLSCVDDIDQSETR